jgi:hypothetical protein
MMTDKDNWQNLDFATKSYKSKADVEADAREMAKTDQCVKLK